jgi:hypothetical protein
VGGCMYDGSDDNDDSDGSGAQEGNDGEGGVRERHKRRRTNTHAHDNSDTNASDDDGDDGNNNTEDGQEEHEEQEETGHTQDTVQYYRGDGSQLIMDSVLVELHLLINREYKLLLCTKCGFAVGPDHSHRTTKPTTQQSQHVQTMFGQHQLQHPLTLTARKDPTNMAPIQGLPVHDKHMCVCGTARGTPQSRRKHVHTDGSQPTWTPTTLQRLTPLTTSFEVRVPINDETLRRASGSARRQASSASSSSSYDPFRELLLPPPLPAPGITSHLGPRDTLGYAKDLGWIPTITSEITAQSVHQLFVSPPDDTPLANVFPVMVNWLKSAGDLVESHRSANGVFLKRLYIFDGAINSKDSFTTIANSSIDTYAATLSALVVFLCR